MYIELHRVGQPITMELYIRVTNLEMCPKISMNILYLNTAIIFYSALFNNPSFPLTPDAIIDVCCQLSCI